MPGLIGYDPNRTRELHRRARRAADHLLRLPPCHDPLAATALSVVHLARGHLEHEWLPALDRVLASSAMLGSSGSGDTGPPAANSLDSELNPVLSATPPTPSRPITGATLPDGWDYTCGPVSASTGQPASGCEWMPPTSWDVSIPLLVASFLPFTGEALDVYDCATGDIPCELIAVPFVSGRGVNALDDLLTGAARAPDVRRSFDFTSDESWRLHRTLDDHFVRHGPDFGSRSVEHYARQASEFLARGAIENLPTKIDPETGIIRIWDPATDTFGAYNADGTTATFYVLEPEKYGYATSLDYWRDQRG